jgi:hypothetical protein
MDPALTGKLSTPEKSLLASELSKNMSINPPDISGN